jgi:AcrR family transcriptional regulator
MARRRHIADALWQIVEQDGFDGVTLRRVAAKAGISMGLVQHYFRTKEEMLLFAVDSMEDRISGRYSARLAALPADPPPRETVRALLLELMPVDATRRTEGHSLYALLAAVVKYPELRDRLSSGIERQRAFVAEMVAAAGIAPKPGQSTDALLALVDGLAAHVFAGFLDPRDAVAILDAQLDSLFGRSDT